MSQHILLFFHRQSTNNVEYKPDCLRAPPDMIPIPVRYVVSRGQTGDMNETKMQATLMSAIFCRKIRCKYTLDGNNVCNHFNKIS